MRTLFETRDLSAVRSYLQRQWTKILAGRVSLQDFVFAKEVGFMVISFRSHVCCWRMLSNYVSWAGCLTVSNCTSAKGCGVHLCNSTV